MKYDYKKVIKDNTTINSESVKVFHEVLNKYPNAKILIEISSTRHISSELLKLFPPSILIRVSGGYDEERVKRNANNIYKDGETGAYYDEAVIYTRNELIKIVEEIEKIENGFHQNWSDIQKIVYTYDKLKREIMYDPKYEYKPSRDTRSLRGLITKQTVCAGYSLIFKEIMDRNGIDCEYVEGYTKKDGHGAHAWNIINLGGKKYAIDLTKDNTFFRAGKISVMSSFTQDIKTFADDHFPDAEEKTQNYLQSLSQMDSNVIDLIIEQISKSREYDKTTYYGTRDDGSCFKVIQIGDASANGTEYFRYYYVDILLTKEKTNPIILYSENNITAMMYGKLHGREIPDNYESVINNILFSKENIRDSIAKRTYYIGRVDKINNQNKREFVSSYKEIEKPENISNLFSLHTRKYTRSDGTSFIAQQIAPYSYNINGIKVIRYDIIEEIKEAGRQIIKRNTVFTEKNFFNDNNQSMVDEYLSRERIDKINEENGGYLGYYDEDGNIKYHEELVSHFKPLEKIEIPEIEEQKNIHHKH